MNDFLDGEINMLERLLEQLELVINSEKISTNVSHDDIDCLELSRVIISRLRTKKEFRRNYGGGITYGDF